MQRLALFYLMLTAREDIKYLDDSRQQSHKRFRLQLSCRPKGPAQLLSPQDEG